MHSFYKFVNDPEALVRDQTLKGFNRELAKQANTDEAVQKYQVLNPVSLDEEYTGKFRSPLYYGAGVELLAHVYFDFFGSVYNLVQVTSMDDWENPQRDTGSDQHAFSMQKKKYHKQKVISQPGSPVRIQVKGGLNPTKKHTTNDGSRIPNFIMNALAEACATQTAYQMRLILFTLGHGLHYVLDNNSYSKLEIVNHNEIKRKIDNNPFFWNKMRESFGLPLIDIKSAGDPEGLAVIAELESVDN